MSKGVGLIPGMKNFTWLMRSYNLVQVKSYPRTASLFAILSLF